MDAVTQTKGLSTEPETFGFDPQIGQTWIYPTNYPTREYQFNIIQAALFKNTLVSLPTGLGKTFIAAVVMYNFYRWYPHGKIIFMAPTRPLVKQQIEACYNIMAIPEAVTAELTGSKISTSRSNIWIEKRVFFVTPQVLQNDLENVAQLGEKIKCLVFDEAHKARGNHAYCQVIRKLTTEGHKYFRVLALSATPGCNVNDVIEVAQNLLISHLEFRTEESKDVEKYVFERTLETVVVPLDDKLMEIRSEYMRVVEYYARTLIKYKIIQGNCGSLTKGKIFMLMKDFQNKNRGASSSNYSEIMRCLNICVTLYHALELLIRHGLRNFLSFFDEHIEKPLLRGNGNLRSIVENVRAYLGPLPHIAVLPDGTYPEIPADIKFGHPKHYKLRDILVKHFSGEDKKNTRVIVFFEYRESVMEAHALLLQSRPLIQPKVFLGQGSGVTQKIQLGVVKAFREGKCNTLLSTCIGEEGLDVGEVDLIVCFDISNKSPIRMVQRMGRTGRKRAGSVLVLVTEGKEQQTLKDCLIHKNNISTHVLGSVQLKNSLYQQSPRLVPDDLQPRCEKLFIAPREKKQNRIIDILKKRSSNSPEIIFSQEDPTIQAHQDVIPDTQMLSLARYPLEKSSGSFSYFNKHLEKMRSLQKVSLVKHSAPTKMLSELLMYADSKRFNVPIKKLGKTDGFSEKSLKQGDIRQMFFSGKRSAEIELSQESFVPNSLQTQVSQTQKDSVTFSTATEEALKILPDYLSGEFFVGDSQCPYCPAGFNCADFTLKPPKNSTGTILFPSEDIVNQITLEAIEGFIASLDQSFYRDLYDEMLEDPSFTQCEDFYENAKKPVEVGQSFFEPPSNFSTVIKKIKPSQENVISPVKEETLLEFFNLKNLVDLFGEDSFESSQKTIIYSPSYLEDNTSLVKEAKEHETTISSPTVEDLRTIGSICDLSYFGLLGTTEDVATSTINKSKTIKQLDKALNNSFTVSPVKNQEDTAECLNLKFSDETGSPVKVHTNDSTSPIISRKTSLNDTRRSLFQSEEANFNSAFNTSRTKTSIKDTTFLDETFVENHVKNSSCFTSPSISNKTLRTKLDSLVHDTTSSSSNFSPPKLTDNLKTAKLEQTSSRFNSPSGLNSDRASKPSSSAWKSKNTLSKPCFKKKTLKVLPRVVSIDDSSDDAFEDVSVNEQGKLVKRSVSPTIKSFANKKGKTLVNKAKKVSNEFLDTQADVSVNEAVIISEDEDECALDEYEKSFVHDVTMNVDTQMHAVYLKSIRSPAVRKPFQRKPPVTDILNVYSQLPINETDSYVNDSFCVDSVEEDSSDEHQMTQLTALEKLLEEKKRQKNARKQPKRKRIKSIPSDDSE